jgi:hypothetical protein
VDVAAIVALIVSVAGYLAWRTRGAPMLNVTRRAAEEPSPVY